MLADYEIHTRVKLPSNHSKLVCGLWLWHFLHAKPTKKRTCGETKVIKIVQTSNMRNKKRSIVQTIDMRNRTKI